MKRITSFHEPGERGKVLRIVAILFTLIGALLLAMGALLLMFGLSTILTGMPGGPPTGATPAAARHAGVVSLVAGLSGIVSVLWSIGSLLSGLQFVTLGALLRLLINLEENTRVTAQSLDKIRIRLESGGEGVEPSFLS
jgi:hypothetical protein